MRTDSLQSIDWLRELFTDDYGNTFWAVKYTTKKSVACDYAVTSYGVFSKNKERGSNYESYHEECYYKPMSEPVLKTFTYNNVIFKEYIRGHHALSWNPKPSILGYQNATPEETGIVTRFKIYEKHS